MFSSTYSVFHHFSLSLSIRSFQLKFPLFQSAFHFHFLSLSIESASGFRLEMSRAIIMPPAAILVFYLLVQFQAAESSSSGILLFLTREILISIIFSSSTVQTRSGMGTNTKKECNRSYSQ